MKITTSKQIKLLFICFLGYFIMSILTYSITPDLIHLMMIWNLFLAFLPLLFSTLVEKNYIGGKKPAVYVYGVLWLLFFPNSPYMITDFIHISGVEFYIRLNGYSPAAYNMAFTPWLKIVHIGIGMLMGILLGMQSMYIIHKVILKDMGKLAAYITVGISCLLSGYAIYIGRFLRFNSWDILHPINLLCILYKNIGWNAFKFSLLFAAYVVVIYFICYIFFDKSEVQK